MINIYYGRNSLNLEKFVYDSIQGNTIILVPDQYKFTAEKQALKYLGLPCIIDMEITDVFGLGRKLINDKYIEMPQIIDSYGRHMLIGRIIKDNKENLKAFKGISDKEAFIDLVSDFIIEFKQNGGNINTLNAIDKIEGTLKDKIEDIKIIFNEYERVLENKYLDNEDFVDKYIKVILDSDEIKEKDLWIYGFENMNVIMSNLVKELSQKAKSVNLVFSYDKESKDKQFVLTGRLIERIKNDTKEVYEFEIPDSYEIDKASDLKKLEAAFQNHDMIKYEDCKPENIKIVEAANPYYEAETIAGNIFNLVMQEGYRLRDIGIICNDTNKMGSIMERTFNEYGISLFHDKTKNISSSPIVHFIINQLEFINRGYTTDDVFAMLKTGLYDIDRDDLEIFEIYANKYSLKGGMWKEKIKYGSFEYSDIELSRLEDIRARIINPIVKLEQIISQCKTYEDFALNYYDYLIEEMDFDNRIEGLCNEQRDMGYLEEALENKQILNTSFDIMNQLVEILGEEEFSLNRFLETYLIGLKYVKVGVIPPKVDELVMGNNQRTRLGEIKVLFVAGVNEGVLPSNPSANNLLSAEEKDVLINNGHLVARNEESLQLEEMAAIYRNISKPKEKLILSYSMSDVEGNDMKPSSIIDEIKYIFPLINTEKDVINQDNPFALVSGRNSTLRHLTEFLQRKEKITDTVWTDVYKWFMDNDPANLNKLIDGICEDNSKDPISNELIKSLFMKDGSFSFSPSRLEKYTRCPFEHYVQYGLKPQELRTYKSEGREIGDIYHECLMRLSKELTEDNIAIKSVDSKWITITKKDCDILVETILDAYAQEYRGGLLLSNKREEYRLKRIKDICKEAAWNMVIQMRVSNVDKAYFEESFGRKGLIQPIVIDLDGTKVFIEGKIDRCDYLKNNTVRIIDYKTGTEKFDKDEVEKGFRLQLMLYLIAAKENVKETAGVFYFLIKEKMFKADESSNENLEAGIEKELKQAYRLDGIFVSEDYIIDDLVNCDKFENYEPSDFIKVKYDKKTEKWVSSGRASSLSKEEFVELEEKAQNAAKKISRNIVEGNISIEPVKLTKKSNRTECDYCKYKGICKFDLDFEGNKYNYI